MKSHLFLSSAFLMSLALIAPALARDFQAVSPQEITIAEGEGHHDSGGHSQAGHHHGAIAIPPGQPIPTVNLIVLPDAEKGWNLDVQVTNFRFVPESVNVDSKTTEGHAHLYVNGEKVTRLYGNWYYLSELPSGRNEITVTLNTNQHEDLMHDGQRIKATAIVEVP
jgi:hypothetical protein